MPDMVCSRRLAAILGRLIVVAIAGLCSGDAFAQTTYSITITATPSDGSIMPKTTPFTITEVPAPPAQTVSQINLSNSQFTAGAGSANATIGTLSATMSPSTPPFSGTFST